MTLISEKVSHGMDVARSGMAGFEKQVQSLEKKALAAVKDARARLEEVRAEGPKKVEKLTTKAVKQVERWLACATSAEVAELAAKVDALTERVDALSKKRKAATND